MRIRLRSYKAGSRSATALAAALGARVLRQTGSTFRPRATDVIVNWGSSAPLEVPSRVLNNPAAVAVASNKLRSFEAFRDAGVSIPEFWTDRAAIPDGSTPGETSAYPIVCRTVLSGHSGAGIVVAETREELVEAPLYVKYIRKESEYRLHVSRDGLIFAQRKARKHDVENPNWTIRNLAGGFAFVLCDEADLPADAVEQAVLALTALGLDFGAVDLLYNRRRNLSSVIEINTAPGLEPRSVELYANFIRNSS